MARSSTTRHGNGSQGPGWGGAAKGAGRGGKRPAEYSASNQPPPEAKSAGWSKREEMLAILETIAKDVAVPPQARVSAVDKYLDRTEGKAVQPTINATVDDLSKLSADELRAELARLAGTGGAAREGTAPKGLPH